MRIREATEADAERAAELWTEAYTGRGGREGRTRPYHAGELALASARATVLVAECERGEVVGIAALVPAGAAGGGVARPHEAELARLAVAEAARGRGVGRALARRCLELARAQGAASVVLWSRPYQVEAHALYESLGFRRAHERDERDADGRRWVFTLDLAPSR